MALLLLASGTTLAPLAGLTALEARRPTVRRV
jgi:hypothetical protein